MLAGFGFENPELLLAAPLAAAPLLLYRRAARFRALLERYADVRVTRLFGVTAALKLALPLLLLLASASPYVVLTRRVEVGLGEAALLGSKPVQHVLVVDVSRSMSYALGIGTRLDAVKGMLREYLLSLSSNDTVVVATFSARVRVVCSGKPAECLPVVEGLRANESYTAVGDALAFSLSLADASYASAAILLFTDGASNYGVDPLSLASRVPPGKYTGAVISVPHNPSMLELARRLGWRYYTLDDFTASSAGELASRVQSEARYDALKARGQAFVEESFRDYTPTYALILLAVAVALAVLFEGA
ncbi:vWA domain-containing protein [Infirmifilum sp. NZ]|uniref:vWA domain-containing protein n=1 Tax=Infirmifilum sp. NZ TaxID=2926850 RepID=UPI0027A1BAEC|nr:vWA domain-containing protein [Infirmifilum sp. NZ]UNQ73437.1 VWA domain-containing protein [Infirmifilum sp. NZ]